MIDGHEIHILGNLTGTLEVLIPRDVCDSDAFDDMNVINFYLTNGTVYQVSY